MKYFNFWYEIIRIFLVGGLCWVGIGMAHLLFPFCYLPTVGPVLIDVLTDFLEGLLKIHADMERDFNKAFKELNS